MPKIMIECQDPNDYEMLSSAVEKAAGKCAITYYKEAQERIDSGMAKSIREAARQIAEEEDAGEASDTIRARIKRGKKQMGRVVPQTKSPSVSQTRFWKSVSKKINKLIDEIHAKGEFPPEIDQGIIGEILDAGKTLSFFMEQLREGR